MSKTKEFVFKCEHMGGTTWTVEHQWAIEGEAQEVVRCRDCIYFERGHYDGLIFDRTVCWAWDNGHDYPCFTHPDGFCHKGERRADG